MGTKPNIQIMREVRSQISQQIAALNQIGVDAHDNRSVNAAIDSLDLALKQVEEAMRYEPEPSLISRISSIEFDRHPIGGNVIALITLDDASTVQVIRQGGGLDFWACPQRAKMSREEQREFDAYMDREFRIRNEEGI